MSHDLTERELEVIEELGRLASIGRTAEVLGITENTARVHITNIARKLGTLGEGTLATVLAAQRLGIIEPPGETA